MSTLKVNAIQDTSGVERYLARAWVNFNGTGTVSIRASGNVSSITDNGVGDYTVNFINALPDANYCPVYGNQVFAAGGRQAGDNYFVTSYNGATQLTTSLRVSTQSGNANVGSDHESVFVVIFR